MAQSEPTLVGSVHADRVVVASRAGTIVMAAEPRAPRPRLAPARALPRPYPPLLDRLTETRQATAALARRRSVQFFGQPGVGKSVLLRHLAHHAVGAAFRDGVVCLPARRVPLADLLQSLYDAFYDRDPAYRPLDAQIAQALRDKQALVVVDDVGLSRRDIRRLLDTAPGCAFVLSATERVLWDRGQAVPMTGVPLGVALALIEREAGEALSDEDKAAGQVLWAKFDGHPFSILQATALALEEGLSLSTLAASLAGPTPSVEVGTQALAGLSEAERSVLAVVASLGGESVAVEHVATIASVPEAEPILARLEQRHLVESHRPRYSLCTAWVGVSELAARDDVWRGRALDHFVRWAEGQTAGSAIDPEVDALLRLRAWAASVGRWRDALRLGRALDTRLMLAGRWGAWAETLEGCLQAARTLGDLRSEGWALHQLGSRELCQREFETARRLLQQALGIREGLGDAEGTSVTRHNLGLLPPPPSARHSVPSVHKRHGGFRLRRWLRAARHRLTGAAS
jgi:hypothetical protein